MKYLKQVFTLCLLLAVWQAQAIHIKGGWMYYEYLGTDASSGNNNYKIVVKVYRDCAVPNNGQNDTEIGISFFRQSDNQYIFSRQATQVRLYRLEKGTFSECINPKPTVCYVILEYSATVSLPPESSGYIASFQRCCRINGIVNVTAPSNTYGNTYTISIPGTTTFASKNSSPIFVEKDTVAVCYNTQIELDYSAQDPDKDSLVYSFTSALTGGSTSSPSPNPSSAPPYINIPYGQGYSSGNPFGTNLIINPNTGIITGKSPATTGEYVLAVSIKEYRNGQFVAETRKELHVNVAACDVAAAVLPIRQITCNGYDVTFENLSASPIINSYYWDFGVKPIFTDTSTKARPTYVYPDTGVYIAKLIVNPNSACTDSATTEVRVFPGFFPDYNFTQSCFLNPVQFTDRSTTKYGVINSFFWDFGVAALTNDTSIQKNPQYTYPQTAGSYSVFLRVASDKGCEDTIRKQVEVLDKPVLKLPFTDTLICSIDSLQLNASGIGTFSWSPLTRMIRGNTANPIVFPLKTTTYNVTLTYLNCTATDSVKVNVLYFITVDAGPDTTICLTDAITLAPVSQGLQFLWSPATTLNNAQIKNPVAKPTAASTTYTVTVNLGKCQAQDNITVRTVPYPIAKAGRDTSVCFADTAILTGTSSGGSSLWTPSSSVAFPTRLITPAYPRGTTNYVLTVFENNGCPKPGRDTVVVNVVPRVQVFAGNDTTIVLGQPLQLNATSNATNHLWTPSLGVSNTSILNPVILIDRSNVLSGTDYFKYVLRSSSAEGCVATDDIVIRLFRTSPTIFVPNAFTPNQDGRNDAIKPILAGMKRLVYFKVFNRYGQVVFETRQQERGWDGLVKGIPQAANAYVYSCEAEDYTGKTVKQNGTFVLIR